MWIILKSVKIYKWKYKNSLKYFYKNKIIIKLKRQTKMKNKSSILHLLLMSYVYLECWQDKHSTYEKWERKGVLTSLDLLSLLFQFE